ncbi:MAG: 4-(cytidine 5'-diphospho)-2-C-methyl-D-erythritol kinase [Parvibaculaceae bacterium]|nr:4-(cytidine 5'-diphospho)-2-C-methyl-D-erythritol kinase [Parvibaculaceae bacterium]
MVTRVVEEARAKVNLSLRVLGRRADGYHELQSLVVFASIGDRIEVHPAADLTLDIGGPFAGALSGEPDNLVLRAACGLRELCGVEAGAHIVLEKNLPVASGIGGGSADAAATLRALMRLWDVAPDEAALIRLAASLGADVPVCLAAAPALMCGTGERIERIGHLPKFSMLLVNPGAPVSTADVFRALTAPPLAISPARPVIPEFKSLDELVRWLHAEPNDLEPSARKLEPLIGDVIGEIAATAGCRLARMSGSGATCFGLYETLEEARIAAAELRSSRPAWWVAASPVSDYG